MLDRIKKKEVIIQDGNNYLDKKGRHIENFGNPLNLMLQHSLYLVIHGSIEDALDEVNKYIEKNNQA